MPSAKDCYRLNLQFIILSSTLIPRYSNIGDKDLKRVWSVDVQQAVLSFVAIYAFASFATGSMFILGTMITSIIYRGLPGTISVWFVTPFVFLFVAVWFSFLVSIFAAVPAILLILALRFVGATGPIAHALAGLGAAAASMIGLNALVFFRRDLGADWPLIAVGAVAGIVYWYAFEKIFAGMRRNDPQRGGSGQ